MPPKPRDVVKESNPFKKFLSSLIGKNSISTADKERVDAFIQAVEPKLKLVNNYHAKLHPSIEICLAHCRKTVTKIPRLAHLNPPRYRDDAAVKPLFAGAESIDILLKNAETAFRPTNPPQSKNRLALLTLVEKEKTIFGNKRDGDMIVTDAAMQAITFVDHKIATIVTEEEQLNEALASYCFNMITKLAAEHLASEISKLTELKKQREMLHVMLKMAEGGKKLATTADGHNKESLKQLLQETEAEISAAKEKGDTPEKWLKYLINYLSWPETILRIDNSSERLDWANVITHNPADNATKVTLATFIIEGNRDQKGVILHYHRA